MANIIGIIALLAVLGIAVGYIVRAKKRGEKCIGCPYAKQCAGAKGASGCCGGGEN